MQPPTRAGCAAVAPPERERSCGRPAIRDAPARGSMSRNGRLRRGRPARRGAAPARRGRGATRCRSRDRQPDGWAPGLAGHRAGLGAGSAASRRRRQRRRAPTGSRGAAGAGGVRGPGKAERIAVSVGAARLAHAEVKVRMGRRAAGAADAHLAERIAGRHWVATAHRHGGQGAGTTS